MARATTNYLNNRDLLIEIHKSKTSYCEFIDPKFANYDAIIFDINVLTDDKTCMKVNKKTVKNYIRKVKKDRLAKLLKENPNQNISLEDILTSDLVFRLMTFDHIPEDTNWDDEKEKKKLSDGRMKVNFPPFQHYIIENGLPTCVGSSHYKDGKFNPDHGRVTNKLGMMFMLLVEKISKKGNWRNYSYIDEMKSFALMQLSQVGLQFNEGRSLIPNPFAFYTTVVTNVFKRVLNTEKRNRDIRDDLIEMSGQNPSFSRQMDEMSGGDFFDIDQVLPESPDLVVIPVGPGPKKDPTKSSKKPKKPVIEDSNKPKRGRKPKDSKTATIKKEPKSKKIK